MDSLTNKNFGFAIAYLLPGFVLLGGLSTHFDLISDWMLGLNLESDATIGGFLYSTLTALLLGLICSTIRWLVVDTLHHATGIARPNWNYESLQDKLGAYSLLEENHYRYYQFYGNTTVAWVAAFFLWRLSETAVASFRMDLGAIMVTLLLYSGSRDTLTKYYRRVEALLSIPRKRVPIRHRIRFL